MQMSKSDTLVLVTGCSGFIGSHCVKALLDAGYLVRGTVRNADKEVEVKRMMGNNERLSFAHADLQSDKGWQEAVRGCTYVHHVASPYPLNNPRDENDLIIPARDGTLRVLRACLIDGSVKKVILTSSIAAVMYGLPNYDKPLDESMWSDPNSKECPPYPKSKTLAERAAWAFMENEAKKSPMKLVSVNPVAVFGEILGKDRGSSAMIIENFLNGKTPFVPKMKLGVIDVRDVASLHLLCMENPKADGQRYLAITGDFIPLTELANMLGKHPGVLPDSLTRLLSYVLRDLQGLLPELGKDKHASSRKAQEELGWSPGSAETAVKSMAESLRRSS